MAGYLDRSNYKCEIDQNYIDDFQSAIKEEFKGQAKYDGKVKLVFSRIFLIGINRNKGMTVVF